jgi:small subunit ribosomal protein S9|tara:strand:+ start:465 stop:872 length:408 start_codon:yes stop_codon:yes gene_type:complete
MVGKILVVSGKRKTAIAKVKIRDGSGNVLYNSLPYRDLKMFHRLSIAEPIKIAEQELGNFNFDIDVKTSGGGKESQIQAARLGIAKALVKFTDNKDLKSSFVKYDRQLLVADVRRKETCKPGDSKARAMRQSSKR